MGNTTIQWTDKTWSPLRARVKADAGEIAKAKGYTSLIEIGTKMAGHVGPHCERVSHGCDHCYSDTNNGRCLPANGTGLPFDRRARDLVDPFVDEKILTQPLSWRAPKKVFVENQSDLFGEWVTDEHIDRVFAIMAHCPQHTFQVLTKRPERMLKWSVRFKGVMSAMRHMGVDVAAIRWPLPNVWLGVSCENQETADARIPLLLQTPAAIRFVSYEPALGPVDFGSIEFRTATWYNALEDHDGFGLLGAAHEKLDWIIVGGESGPGARPFNIAWARQTIEQCKAAGVACFVKQFGAKPYRDGAHRQNYKPDGPGTHREKTSIKLKDRKGGDWLEWSPEMRVREFPAVPDEPNARRPFSSS